MEETKNLLGLTLLPAAIVGATALAVVSFRIRDIFFILLVVLTIMTFKLDVNFVSREWYRGTTRGFEFSSVDILAISVFLSSFFRPRPGYKRLYWPPGFGFMLLFFCFACFSVAVSTPKLFGFFELSKMLRGMIVFMAAALFVQSPRELRILIFGIAFVVCWQGLLALEQRYHQHIHRVPGMLVDPNSLSMYLCLTAPALVAAVTSDLPKFLKYCCSAAMLLAGVAIVLTISRTGVVTMVLVMLGATLACASLKFTVKKAALSLVVILAACGIFIKAWPTLAARYNESSLTQEYRGKGQGRGYYLRIAAAIAHDRWLGVGLNNWSYWVSNEYGPQLGWRFVPYIGTDKYPSDAVPSGRNLDAAQAAPAHNLGALTLGELGPPGLFLFSLVWLRWFQMGLSFFWKRSPDPMLRLGVGFFFCTCGIFLESLTEWVYRLTPIFFTFNILMGALASLYYLKRARKRKEVEQMRREAEFAADQFGGLSISRA
ncbi:MAG: hypothetical protein JWR26_1953 [Pedosphaera sp.]|nr:hypothetical protein [Pedosphaera sp.]